MTEIELPSSDHISPHYSAETESPKTSQVLPPTDSVCGESIRRRKLRMALVATCALSVLIVIGLLVREQFRYHAGAEMIIELQEFSDADYPEDPAGRSPHFGKYSGRRLHLIQRDDNHFDFLLEPLDDRLAEVSFRDINVSLMTPALPESCRGNDGNIRIALTDRQWNRQQVAFPADGPHIEVKGGDGFEVANLYSAELAKNCLNAGLWEVLLFTNSPKGKELYYQGWFTFPLGHYRRLFEQNTGLSYREHWYYLEHWFDPAGTIVALDSLRRVDSDQSVQFTFNPKETILASGEQVRKRRTFLARNVRQWQDFTDSNHSDIAFASFIPPGRYSVHHQWHHEYGRIERVESVGLRRVRPSGQSVEADELELVFRGNDDALSRFLISGFHWDDLPQLSTDDYHRGLYMPMGIGVPPFYQSYSDLQAAPPQTTPWVCVLLDEQDRWIDHHKAAIDGPVMHRDAGDPDLLHLYLLSYERHSLITHLTIRREADL